ncbi:MAG: hypothetical protein M3R04_04905 [bacterium]|nr:hypothetical protein [bacterium]
MGHRVTVYCPAKVNLGLEVLGRRADGYHDICTMMQVIDLYDELTLEVVDGDGSEAPDIELSGPFANEVPPTGNTLLAAWAYGGGNKFPALRVSLVKNIPSGAGLGGGSSNGAGMLLALRELSLMMDRSVEFAPARPAFAAKDIEEDRAGASHMVEPSMLPATALRIGSDCPFFLSEGCQLAEGRGERLTPIDRRLDFHLVVGIPQFGSATGPSYAQLRRPQQTITPMLVPQLARALAAGNRELFAASVVNDFAPVLQQRHPQYLGWLSRLMDEGAMAATITGSGSGFFGIFESEADACLAADGLQTAGLRYCGLHKPISY